MTEGLLAWRGKLEAENGSGEWIGWIASVRDQNLLFECTREVPPVGVPLRLVVEKFQVAETYECRSLLVSGKNAAIKVLKRKGRLICDVDGRRRIDSGQVTFVGTDSELMLHIVDAGASGIGFICEKQLPAKAWFPLCLKVNDTTLNSVVMVVHQHETATGEWRGGLLLKFIDRLDRGTWIKFIEGQWATQEKGPTSRDLAFPRADQVKKSA